MKKSHIFICLLSLQLFSIFSQTTKQTLEASNINGYMPEEIFVTTPTQTFCKDFSFLIQSGKIWVKQDGQSEWSLFLGTGLPYFSKDSKLPGSSYFSPPKAVAEIYADGDAIFAFDTDGCMYRCYLQDTTADPPFQWLNNFGWPKKQILRKEGTIKDSVTWGMGVRRKDILWYEDRYNNQHHYGTMGLETIYFLTKNGKEIRFTDSGLPCSPSKTILGPERGAFVAKNMSVSGSTLFLINDAGEMYTRLIDYDTMGCDPMFFKYSYNPGQQKYSGKNYRSNYTLWGLPNEDWAKQPEINLTGKARLTKYICIYQNGQGNEARMLRVAGLSETGQSGFYQKMLEDKNWTFVPAQLKLDSASFLEYASEGFATDSEIRNSLRGKKNEYSYQGFIYQNGTKIETVECSIPDFTLTTEGSCTFQVKDSISGEQKDFTFHPLEIWTYAVQDDPGFDGTTRNFFITPEFNENNLDFQNQETSSLIKTIFEGTNQKLYAFTAFATTDYVEINIESKNRSIMTIFLTKEKTNLSPQQYKAQSYFSHPSILDTNAQQLLLDNSKTYTVFDAPDIYNKIQNNKEELKKLASEATTFAEYSREATTSRWGYTLLDFITTITFLNKLDFPKFKTATMFGGDIMKTNQLSFQSVAEYRTFIYPFATKIIQTRITAYNKLLTDISRKTEPKISERLSNSFTEYFEKAGIPSKLTGKSPLLNCNECFIKELQYPMYAGLQLTFSKNNENHVVIVEIPDFAECYLNATSKVIKCNASFRQISINQDKMQFIYKIMSLTQKYGIFEWDGQNMTIYSSNKKDILFTSAEK